MIDVKATIGGKEYTFKFKPMTPAETATWGAKLRARYAAVESLSKRIELAEKEGWEDRDPKEYLALQDKLAFVKADILEVATSLSQWCVEPSPATVVQFLGSLDSAAAMTEALLSYLGKLLPSTEEQKK